MSTIMPGSTGWLIFHSDGLDEIAVTNGAGDVIASRPLAVDAVGVTAWDSALAALGYVRTSPWTPAQGGFRANVAPNDQPERSTT